MNVTEPPPLPVNVKGPPALPGAMGVKGPPELPVGEDGGEVMGGEKDRKDLKDGVLCANRVREAMVEPPALPVFEADRSGTGRLPPSLSELRRTGNPVLPYVPGVGESYESMGAQQEPDRLKAELQNVPGVGEGQGSRVSLGKPDPLKAAVQSGVAEVPVGFWRKLALMFDWVFGFVALLVLLAGCSVVPVLNFLSLGYLLHVSGTIARTGRFRDGFIGVRKAAVLGRIAAGIWLVVWPARLISTMWKDAELVAAGSGIAKAWHAGLVVVIGVTLVHIAWACVRGGKLRHFLWPQPLRFVRWLRAPEKFGNLQRGITDYVNSLRLPFYFWLGLRGFVGALLWLAVPVGILMGATRLPVGGSVLLSMFGGLLLLLVAIHLPFLQARFAQTDRFGAMFELREVRRLFVRAPLAFWFSLIITLLFAVPLYLLKIELTPRELAWLPSLLFVVFIFPARVLTGWAMSRATRREEPRHWFPRWVARLGIVPVALVYTLVVYFTPYLSWNGAWSLLEQHAFLVPAPLMAL